MHTLDAAVAEAFALQGFEVSRQAVLEGRSGSVHTIPILAEDAQAILVFIDMEQEADLHAIAALRTDLAADLAIVVGRSDAVDGIVCWDRTTLETILGQAAVARAGYPAPPLPLATPAPSTLGESMPASFQDSPQAPMAAATPQGEAATEDAFGFDLDALQSGALDGLDLAASESEPAPAAGQPGIWTPPPPAGFRPPAMHPTPIPAASEPAAAPTAATPDPDDGQPAPSDLLWDVNDNGTADPQWDLAAREAAPVPIRLPVRLTPRQAFDYAKGHMGTVDRYELILQPVHLFDAEVDTFVQGSLDARTRDLRLEVNGTDRAVRQVDPKMVDPSAPDLLPGHHDIPLTERNLRIAADRAMGEARLFLKQEFARTIEVPSGDDDLYSMTERRRVEPNDDEVRVRPIGIYHRPVWRLMGVHGTVEVDAMTGEATPVNLRSFPDAIILD